MSFKKGKKMISGNWKEKELDRLNSVLGELPEEHVRENEYLSEIVREEILIRNGKRYPRVSGMIRPLEGSLTLFDAAFREPLQVGDRLFPFFDLTLKTLVGHSLFYRDDVRLFWAKNFYPPFDRGRGTSRRVKLTDRDGFWLKPVLHSNSLSFNPDETSLEESFALCYAFFTLAPIPFYHSYPKAHRFFRDKMAFT